MVVGLDLGSAQVGISLPSRKQVYREPAAVAIDTRNRKVLAVGEPADRMRGRSTGHIEVIRPIESGIAATPQLVEVLIKHMLRRGLGWRRLLRPTLAVSVPVGMTSIEREALHEAVLSAGAGRARLVPAPMAAGLGAGASLLEPVGRMVVDIGATHTQAALIYLGSVVASGVVPFGGDSMDEAIVRYFRDDRGLSISESQAEALKIKIGCASPAFQALQADVTGREVQTGLPVTRTVRGEEICHALQGPLEQVASLVRSVLSQTPAEMASDLMENGIILTGGAARLRGLAEYLQHQGNVPVRLASDPETCAVRGSALTPPRMAANL